MNLRILPSALSDLREGWAFYEDQQIGLGEYFQDSLFQISIRCFFLPEFTELFTVITACYRSDSLTPYTTNWREMGRLSYGEYWT